VLQIGFLNFKKFIGFLFHFYLFLSHGKLILGFILNPVIPSHGARWSAHGLLVLWLAEQGGACCSRSQQDKIAAATVSEVITSSRPSA
jgi:hypothetical protein